MGESLCFCLYACEGGIVSHAFLNDYTAHAKRKTMAEPHETLQGKETRWTAQRAAHDEQQHAYRAARTREIARNWLVVGVIVLIAAVMTAAVLL